MASATGVSRLLIEEVVADVGEIVAFEIEEAPGDVEGVRWIQEQAEAGDTVSLLLGKIEEEECGRDSHTP
jgi:hypothetical protein